MGCLPMRIDLIYTKDSIILGPEANKAAHEFAVSKLIVNHLHEFEMILLEERAKLIKRMTGKQ